MIDVFSILKGLLRSKRLYIDHWVFRLHSRFTVLLLLFFCIVVSTKQYAGEPIKCTRGTLEYSSVVDTYCFTTTTYTVKTALHLTPTDGAPHPGISQSQDASKYRYHVYYQWIGFVLFLQGVFFYLPHYLWKNYEGGKLAWLLEHDVRFFSSEEKMKCKELIVDHLRSRWCGGNAYVLKYFFCEFLCLVNVMGQMQMLNKLFEGEYLWFGIEAMQYFHHGSHKFEDPLSRIFPRVTSCTFRYFGETGKVRSVSVLCVLAINVVNEKIFLFLWFWFIFLILITMSVLALKLIIFPFKRLRLAVLRFRFRQVRPDDLCAIVESGDASDYLFIHLLGQNMEEVSFQNVISDFVTKLQGKIH